MTGPRLTRTFATGVLQAARAILAVLVEELRSLDERVAVLDREIARHAKENAVARRLMTIPGIGAVTAAALTALAHRPTHSGAVATLPPGSG